MRKDLLGFWPVARRTAPDSCSTGRRSVLTSTRSTVSRRRPDPTSASASGHPCPEAWTKPSAPAARRQRRPAQLPERPEHLGSKAALKGRAGKPRKEPAPASSSSDHRQRTRQILAGRQQWGRRNAFGRDYDGLNALHAASPASSRASWLQQEGSPRKPLLCLAGISPVSFSAAVAEGGVTAS